VVLGELVRAPVADGPQREFQASKGLASMSTRFAAGCMTALEPAGDARARLLALIAA
jgi:hypothetical protein